MEEPTESLFMARILAVSAEKAEGCNQVLVMRSACFLKLSCSRGKEREVVTSLLWFSYILSLYYIPGRRKLKFVGKTCIH